MKPIKLKIETKTQTYPIIIGSNLINNFSKIIKKLPDKTPATAPIIIAFAGETKAQDAVIPTNPAIGPVIINIGSGFLKTIIPIMLDEISPADAAMNVFIKISGILKSIAKLAPPLKPNQPNHKINVPKTANGKLEPVNFPLFASEYLPILGPKINTAAKAIHPPTE